MPLVGGAEFAGYTILRLLGSGGLGEVYLAQHPHLPRRDALKILAQELTADREFRDTFHREADLAATLWHPNVVRVHDHGEFDGRLWIATDYVEGTDAAQLLKDEYPSGMPARGIGCTVAKAVFNLSAMPSALLGLAPSALARMPVAIEPGEMELTRTPCSPSSIATQRVRCTTAALAAP